MAARITSRQGETTQHARLKQLAFIWAQTHGFSACAMEVTLPRCRYRADVDAYRAVPKQIDQQRSSNANRRCAICDETIVAANRRASDSKQYVIVARFSKRVSARIIQTSTLAIRFSRSLIPRTSPRSVTAVTRVLFVSCGRCKTGFTIAQSSKN